MKFFEIEFAMVDIFPTLNHFENHSENAKIVLIIPFCVVPIYESMPGFYVFLLKHNNMNHNTNVFTNHVLVFV